MESIFKKPDDAATPNEMRAAIERAGSDNPLVHRCLTLARRDGLSAEDTYTLLAYHALRMHSDAIRQMMETACLQPAPQIVVVDRKP